MCLLQNCASAAIKRLSEVEVNGFTSNQHEFHGVAAFREIFGDNTQHFQGICIHVDHVGNIHQSICNLTWYDAREASSHLTGRTEYRFYYTSTAAVSSLNEDDTLIVGLRNDGVVILVIIDQNNPITTQIFQHTNYYQLMGNYYYSDFMVNPYLQTII